MRRNFLNFLIIIPLVIFIACERSDEPAMGPEDEIFVVADSLEFEELRDELERAFEKTIYTPQPEKLFLIKRISPNQLENYKARKNIVITAPLNSGTNTSKFINALMDSSDEKLAIDETSSITRNDLWAKEQLVMLLTAPTIEELEEKILDNADKLLYSFQKISDKRLYKNLYNEQYEQENIEGKFLKDYGWIIYVQADYKVELNKPEDNFVWLRRSPDSDMEKWIFIHWIENASPAYLNEDSIHSIRNRLTEKYYKTSDSSYAVINKDYFVTSEVNFKGKYALMTQGLWEIKIKGTGGPFVSYTFFDDKTNRVYMLDGSVFAPKYYKRSLIQQMDVMLQSFMISDEISKEKRESLLNAAED